MFESTQVLSAYGRRAFSYYLATAKTENRILYVNKKRSQVRNTTGLQLSNNILSLDSTHSLAQYKELIKKVFAGTIFANNAGTDAIRFSQKSGNNITDPLARMAAQRRAKAEADARNSKDYKKAAADVDEAKAKYDAAISAKKLAEIFDWKYIKKEPIVIERFI